jgi:Trk K+ transport system NAD-binding subunit
MSGFGMFDFSMVGVPLTLVGVAFIALLGWRLVPARKQAGTSDFETSAYITEVLVQEGSASVGKQVGEIRAVLEEVDAQMLDLVRNDIYKRTPRPGKILRAGDILVLEADVGALTEVLSCLDLKLEEDKRGNSFVEDVQPAEEADARNLLLTDEEPTAGTDSGSAEKSDDQAKKSRKSAQREEQALMEMAVLPESKIVRSSASDLALRTRFGINLLAVARQGTCTMARLRSLKIQPGDVLLMQGSPEALNEFASNSACVPLAQRELRIPDKRKALMATGWSGSACASRQAAWTWPPDWLLD